MSVVLYDSITVSSIPPNPPAVAGYVGGFWPDFSEEVRAFPKAKHLSIAVNASEDAECLDVEAGDATPSQAPAWVKRQQARGVVKPVVYASVSAMHTVLAELAAQGIKREDVRVWTAHYTFQPHLCAAPEFGLGTVADATQWTDRALGRNLDQSLCSDAFFANPAPPAKNKIHYERFDRVRIFGKVVDEAKVVRRYDKLRPLMTPTHKPYRARVELLGLRLLCRRLAKRIDRLAVRNNRKNYRLFHRGYRRFQLWGRAQGGRFV